MFGRQETAPPEDRVPAGAQEVFNHRGPVKVLQLDIEPRKAEKQLERWIAAGWTVTSTAPVALLGQTAFLVCTLERNNR